MPSSNSILAVTCAGTPRSPMQSSHPQAFQHHRPTQSMPTQSPRHAHFVDDQESSDDDFPEPLPPPSSSEDEDDHFETPQRPSASCQTLQTPTSRHLPLATARRLSRTPGTPRQLAHAAAGQKKKICCAAHDIWSFYLKTGDRYHCAFCMYI